MVDQSSIDAGSDPVDSDALGEEDRRYRLAFDRAVRLLAQREHSVRELTTKLTGKGVDAATAGLVVDDLRGRGLQSDSRFTEAFVHSRMSRGQGPVRIRQELSQRGIDSDVADAALAGGTDGWLELAVTARRKKFGDDLPVSRADWARQARFLTSRGFPAQLVYRVLGSDAD
jgi:regulatory protein